MFNLNLGMVGGTTIRQLQFEEYSAKQQLWTLERQKQDKGTVLD